MNEVIFFLILLCQFRSTNSTNITHSITSALSSEISSIAAAHDPLLIKKILGKK